ncbi:NTP transferase domain-containing protein [Natronobiforma cellulositropha]|uniref:NTP transferase domain-containing protein n=1 Tax=Natronobiforma cellulositropha TaxID=1679076 RepID=UPI0021D5C053|nr:NTP transferase domain-containing protein [Natronobiforma cellulositropha]
MCGGAGTRLESDREKPLYPIGGEAMVERVLGALEASRLERTYAAVSPQAPATQAHLERRGVTCIETAGAGYVSDLLDALRDERLSPPVLTVAADLPLLEGSVLDRVCAAYGRVRERTEKPPSLTVCVPVALKRRLGASVETTLEGGHLAPTGVNVVGDGSSERQFESYDRRLAVNVNRRADARLADRLVST